MSTESQLHAIDQNGECIQGCGMGVCPTVYGDGIEWERNRLVKLVAAMEAEGVSFTSESFERMANLVIEEGSMRFSSEPTDDGVMYRMDRYVRLKDGRDE